MLRKIVVEAGRTVPVGALIGVIAAPDESIDEILAKAAAATTADGAEAALSPSPEPTAGVPDVPDVPDVPVSPEGSPAPQMDVRVMILG